MPRTVPPRLLTLAAGAILAVASPVLADATAFAAPSHAEHPSVTAGLITLSIKLKGAEAKDILRLQTPHGRSWLTLQTTRLDGHRQGSFKVTVPETRKLRFYLEATKKHKSATFHVDPARLK